MHEAKYRRPWQEIVLSFKIFKNMYKTKGKETLQTLLTQNGRFNPFEIAG
jgi:hypothetical protein